MGGAGRAQAPPKMMAVLCLVARDQYTLIEQPLDFTILCISHHIVQNYGGKNLNESVIARFWHHHSNHITFVI